MSEIDKRISKLSDTEIIFKFRNALVALYPILKRLSCLEDDTQTYDDFDSIAENLWKVIVARSLMWKYGLTTIPKIPLYGFIDYKEDLNGYIQVDSQTLNKNWRFLQFIGNRKYGEDIFNAVEGINENGEVELCGLWSELSFRYVSY